MDEILNNPEISTLNGQLAIAAAAVVRFGERFLDETSPRVVRLWAHARAMCAVYDCKNILDKLNQYPEIRQIQAEIAKKHGITDGDTIETVMQKLGFTAP